MTIAFLRATHVAPDPRVEKEVNSVLKEHLSLAGTAKEIWRGPNHPSGNYVQLRRKRGHLARYAIVFKCFWYGSSGSSEGRSMLSMQVT